MTCKFFFSLQNIGQHYKNIIKISQTIKTKKMNNSVTKITLQAFDIIIDSFLDRLGSVKED